jgi:hypothetical protein
MLYDSPAIYDSMGPDFSTAMDYGSCEHHHPRGQSGRGRYIRPRMDKRFGNRVLHAKGKVTPYGIVGDSYE